jgi:hypothetical protein
MSARRAENGQRRLPRPTGDLPIGTRKEVTEVKYARSEFKETAMRMSDGLLKGVVAEAKQQAQNLSCGDRY